jgi:hypothetical protein
MSFQHLVCRVDLWLLWTNELNLTILESAKHYIFAKLSLQDGTDWTLGAIYGDASHRENPMIWSKIKEYADVAGSAFCCMGDFNAVPTVIDKYGGSQTLNTNNRTFRHLLSQANLIDMGYSGPAFTWTNSQHTSNPIYQRLDRVLISPYWQELFPKAQVKHLHMLYSDHAPILLQARPPEPASKDFRMEHWWMRLEGFDQECRRLWLGSEGMDWNSRHCTLGKGLQKWAKNKPLPENRLREIEKELLEVQLVHPSVRNHTKEAELAAEYEKVDSLREIKWHQRSKIRWATVGDKNTKFFHNAATQRWRRNRITTLQRENGIWTIGEAETRSLLVNYFKKLYAEGVTQADTEVLMENSISLLPSIQQETHSSLIQIPSCVEVHRTLCTMGLDRAPGPDGITARLLKE